jgi:hypothetical protein
MKGFTEKILDVLIACVIFFALIGVIVGSTNSSVTWSALNVGGTIKDFSYVPYILILVILVGAVLLVYNYMLKKK